MRGQADDLCHFAGDSLSKAKGNPRQTGLEQHAVSTVLDSSVVVRFTVSGPLLSGAALSSCLGGLLPAGDWWSDKSARFPQA
jgi:hypothetical protein